MQYKPKRHHALGISRCVKNPHFGLLAVPGAGKTSIMLETIRRLKKAGKVSKVLVIGTATSVESAWCGENEKWFKSFGFSIGIIEGKNKEAVLKQDHDIYLMSYGIVDYLKKNSHLFRKIDTIILDEGSKIKNWTTVRCKILTKLAPMFKRRYILTGSPAPRDYMDIFSLIRFLDGGERLSKYITAYRNEYFEPYGFKGYEWRIQEGGKERIVKRIKDIVLSLGTEVLDLPPLTTIMRPVYLPEEVYANIYAPMEKERFAMIGDQPLTSPSAITALQKLRQISNGFVYMDPHANEEITAENIKAAIERLASKKVPNKVADLHANKCEALLALIEELDGGKCLIGYDFKHDRHMIEEHVIAKLPKKVQDRCRFVDSKTSKPMLRKILQDWDDGKIDYFFGQTSKLAHGLNLQSSGCYQVALYSLTWVLEDFEQFVRRVLRPGQTSSKVILHLLMARGTIDEGIYTALNHKDYAQTDLFNAFKAYKNKRLGNSTDEERELIFFYLDNGSYDYPIFDPNDQGSRIAFAPELVRCIFNMPIKALKDYCRCFKIRHGENIKISVRRHILAAYGIVENTTTYTITDDRKLENFMRKKALVSQFRKSAVKATVAEEEATGVKLGDLKKGSNKKNTKAAPAKPKMISKKIEDSWSASAQRDRTGKGAATSKKKAAIKKKAVEATSSKKVKKDTRGKVSVPKKSKASTSKKADTSKVVPLTEPQKLMKKVLVKLQRKSGAKIQELSTGFGVTVKDIRNAIDRLRRSGVRVHNIARNTYQSSLKKAA